MQLSENTRRKWDFFQTDVLLTQSTHRYSRLTGIFPNAHFNKFTYQNRLKGFSLEEYFTRIYFNRNTIHQLLWKLLPKHFSINFDRAGNKKKQ